MDFTTEESIEIRKLIEAMIEDIKRLSSEAVTARAKIVSLADEIEARNWDCDILSNLSTDFTNSKIYQDYVDQCCGGVDPLDSEEWTKEIESLAHPHRK